MYIHSGLGLGFVELFRCVEDTLEQIAGWKCLVLMIQIQRVKAWNPGVVSPQVSKVYAIFFQHALPLINFLEAVRPDRTRKNET